MCRISHSIHLQFSNRLRRNGAALDGTQQRRALLLVPTDYVDQHTKRSTFLLPRGFHHEILPWDTPPGSGQRGDRHGQLGIALDPVCVAFRKAESHRTPRNPHQSRLRPASSEIPLGYNTPGPQERTRQTPLMGRAEALVVQTSF